MPKTTVAVVDMARLINKVSPLRLGLGISGLLIAILLLGETLLGRWEYALVEGQFDALARVSTGVLRDVRIAIVHCLLIGYLPAALLHTLQSARRTVLQLQDALDCTREECEKLAASVRLSGRWLIITAVLGLLFSISGPYLVPPVPPSPWNPANWNFEVMWHRILGPGTGILGWWLGYAIVIVSWRMSLIANKLSRIDLLDLSSLGPFTQQGLTNALLLVGLISIWSLMLIETGFEQIMIINSAMAIAGIAMAMLLPLRGVHRRIRRAKEEALSWVNAEISKHRTAFEKSASGRRDGEMADLIAYRSLIDDVSEWPFTTSTYFRLFLYALLPILSWSVGVVAEEIIGRALF